jgi:acyl carrier protein
VFGALVFEACANLGWGEMTKHMSEMELKEFLTGRISSVLRVKNKDMDPDKPFAQYGLESIDSVILAMEIEEEIGIPLEPTLLWEHNTINLCASLLHKNMTEQAA